MASNNQPRKHDIKVPVLDSVSKIKEKIKKGNGRFSVKKINGD
jgi:hypothetical protein